MYLSHQLFPARLRAFCDLTFYKEASREKLRADDDIPASFYLADERAEPFGRPIGLCAAFVDACRKVLHESQPPSTREFTLGCLTSIILAERRQLFWPVIARVCG
jgi:hypothetical protein